MICKELFFSSGDCVEISNSFRYKPSDQTDFIGIQHTKEDKINIPTIILKDDQEQTIILNQDKKVEEEIFKVDVEKCSSPVRVESPGSEGKRKSLSTCYREKKMAETRCDYFRIGK